MLLKSFLPILVEAMDTRLRGRAEFVRVQLSPLSEQWRDATMNCFCRCSEQFASASFSACCSPRPLVAVWCSRAVLCCVI